MDIHQQVAHQWWHQPVHFPGAILAYRNNLIVMSGAEWNPETNLPEAERRVITPEEFRSGRVVIGDPELIRYLAEHPEALRSVLTWRQFEELVAELLKKSKHEVHLSRRGRDGGIDIVAYRAGEFGPELTLVQCKHWEDMVGEPVVKQLYADVDLRRATHGLLVTTSHFTRDALKRIEEVKYRLAGRDLDALQDWMKKTVGG